MVNGVQLLDAIGRAILRRHEVLLSGCLWDKDIKRSGK